MSLDGTCLCGAVKVTIPQLDADSTLSLCLLSLHPDCEPCRKATGGLAAHILLIPEKDAEISGELKGYTEGSESGRTITRLFCPTCGSRIHDRVDPKKSEYVYLHAGLFPPGSLPKPKAHIWTRRMESWEQTYPDASVSEKQ